MGERSVDIEAAKLIAEGMRLDEVYHLGILDSPREERFDRITRMARQVFDVPIALISVVDAERQWYKSCQGLDTSETPRSISFCAHAIIGDGTMVVRDAQLDPRFATMSCVTGDPFIRFYAGQPIRGPGGHKLGTLCIVDRKPRELSPEQHQTLQDLARWAEDEIKCTQYEKLIQSQGNAEATLLATSERFRALFDYSPDGVLLIDPHDGMTPEIVDCNEVACRMHGDARDEMVGQSLDRFLPPDVGPAKWARLLDTLQQNGSAQFETTRRRKDGTVFHVEASVARITLAGHTYVLEIDRDITVRLRSERFMAVRHAVSRVLADAVTIDDAATRILEALGEQLGWAVGEFWIVDSHADVLRRAGAWHLPSETTSEFEISGHELTRVRGEGFSGAVWESNQPIWLDTSRSESHFKRAQLASKAGLHRALGFPIQFGQQTLGVVVVLSRNDWGPREELLALIAEFGGQIGHFIEHRRAEAALNREREFLDAVLGTLTDGVVACDAEGLLTLFNPTTQRLHGLPAIRLPPPEWAAHYNLFYADGTTRMRHEDIPLYRALQGETVQDAEMVVVPQDGPPRRMLANGQAIIDAAGIKVGAVVAMHDVTEQKRAEAEREELLGQMQKALARTDTLYRTGQSLIALTDLPELLQTVVDNAAAAVPADRVTVITIDQVTRDVTHYVKGGPDAAAVATVEYDELWDGLTGWVLRERQ
ncbi:MAG: hypothetical protein NVS4B8_16080 [Herpetosiphon sp.]